MAVNSKEELRSKLGTLITEFREGDFWNKNEIQIQTDFTLPLLEILGWDKLHRDIDPQQKVDTGKRPDILLKNKAKSTVMVIESKKSNNKDILEKGFYGSGKKRETFEEQLFRYCKSEGKYWGVLTNFVEWRLYSSHLKSLYYRKIYAFHDLLWKDVDKSRYVDLMSDEGLEFLLKLRRDVLWKNGGKFDLNPDYYPEESEIRKEFFEYMRKWRGGLVKHLTDKYGKSHTEAEIDMGAQRILDRMIFIEVCTDREVVAEDALNAILSATRKSFYGVLKDKFAGFNQHFNSGLLADNWIDHIEIENPIIEPIIIGINGIDFNSLSVHVMGEVYEEYIGKELQKKTGAYYTPKYIVEYIVENTVGELLRKAKTEADIRKIKVLDPACGSGSFLIKTFDAFIEAYERLNKKKKKDDTLDLFDRDRRVSILRDNIYGVDIDERAVEIAKLNLLIKALEGARYDNITPERLLPDLSLNIRVGNSLIGGEQLGGEKEGQTWLFDTKYDRDKAELLKLRQDFATARNDKDKERIYKVIEILEFKISDDFNINLERYFDDLKVVKAFNYTVAFPDVFSEGGFDAVIGNPPYLDSELMTKEQPENRDYISRSEGYEFTKGNWDIYIAFLERAYKLVKEKGYWSFITPDKWISKPFGKALRAGTLKYINILLNAGRDVFKNSKIDAIVSVYCKIPTTELKLVNAKNRLFETAYYMEKNNIMQPYRYDFLFSRWVRILSKIDKLSANETIKFCCESACATSDAYKLKSLIENSKSNKLNRDKYYKIVNTGTIGKYVSKWGIKEMTYLGNRYLKPVCNRAEFNKHFKGSYGNKAEKPKVIIKGLTLLDGCLDLEGDIIPGKSTLVIYSDEKETLKYLSAIFNSKLALFYISEKYSSSSYNKGINFTKDMFNNFPVLLPNKKKYREFLGLVDRIIPIQNESYIIKDEKRKKEIITELEALYCKINDLVYELYGLTDDEIKIIKSS